MVPRLSESPKPLYLFAFTHFRTQNRFALLLEMFYSRRMIRSLARPIAWLLLAAVLFVTISPISMRPVTAEPAGFERFAAYALIGVAFAIGYPRRWLLVACLVTGSAFAFEAAQLLAPGRHAHLEDAIAKALGGLTGVMAGGIINRLSPPGN